MTRNTSRIKYNMCKKYITYTKANNGSVQTKHLWDAKDPGLIAYIFL